MRGAAKLLKSLIVSGQSYLQGIDEEEIENAKKGDMMFYPVLSGTCHDVMSVYEKKGFKGFFKAEIYDGKMWCLVDMLDFFAGKENHFSKSEMAIYAYENCKEIISKQKNVELFRSYREHYTKDMPERNGFKGRKDSINKK